MRLPRCKKCGVLLGVDQLAGGSLDLCGSCFKKVNGKSAKRCIICRKPIKSRENVVRQQIGLITSDGGFSPLEDLWYQHARCRTISKTRHKTKAAKRRQANKS